MKRRICLILVLLTLLSAFAGCKKSSRPKDGAFSVVVTVYPAYDWLRNVLGDRAEQFDIKVLQDSGVDLHSYQPSTGDILRITECDLFIYVGGVSDGWVTDALAQKTNETMQVICLMDVLGERAVTEEFVEGMEAEPEEDAETDEHVWLSLRNAELFTEQICRSLCSLDSDNAETYRANAASYCEKLQALDAAYTTALANCAKDTLLFADRFPFRYLVEDYGLTYYAAFAGCSAESEAGVSTVLFLSEKLKELKLPVILILENSDERLARTVLETAGLELPILRLNSMQSVTTASAEGDYLDMMQQNLAVLKTALEG